MDNKIPPRLIQTARSAQLPLRARAAVTGLQLLNPGFEYRFFDDAQVDAFVRDEFPQHLRLFESFPYRIQKFDFFRYLAVYRLGGFYFDTDVFFAAGLRELLDHRCVFPFEELTIFPFLRDKREMDWEIGNYAFGAAAGHPFIEAIIQNCVRAQQEPAWAAQMLEGIPPFFRSEFDVLVTTGPGLISRTLAENPKLAGDVTVLFPDDVCDNRTWHQFGNFGVHEQEGSWRVKGGFLFRRIANIWEARSRRRALAGSRRRGKARNTVAGSPAAVLREA
jgi:hypothetical protein